MSIAEKIFRVLSLGALMVGFLIGMISADKDLKIDQAAFKTESLIQDIQWKEVVDEINAGEFDASKPVTTSSLTEWPVK